MNAYILRGIGAGLISALLFLAASTGGVIGLFLFYIASLPLFLAGLSGGYSVALAGAIAGSLLSGVMTGVTGALMFAVLCGIAPVILCRFGLLSRTFEDQNGQPVTQWYPVGFLICWIAGLACGAIVLAALVLSGQDGGLIGWIETFLADHFGDQLRALLSQIGSPFSEDDALKAMARNVPYATGLIWIFTALINGVLAQAILVKSGHNIRPKTSYSDWFLPRELNLALAVALVVALFDGTIGTVALSLSMLLLIPYFLLGLAVIHTVSRRFKGREFMLASLYMVLLLLGWPALLVTLVGLFEQWTGLRNRWADNNSQS